MKSDQNERKQLPGNFRIKKRIQLFFSNFNVHNVIRHVFCFGTEFFENKDIGIFGHFIVIDFFFQAE